MNDARHISSETLSALLDGVLDESASAAARAHLADCPRCTERLESWARLGALVRDEPVPAVPADLRQRIGRSIAARPSHRPWLAAAAVLVGAVLIGVLVRNESLTPVARHDAPADRASEPLDAEAERQQREKLESLGYVGGAQVSDEPFSAPSNESRRNDPVAGPELKDETTGHAGRSASTGERETTPPQQAPAEAKRRSPQRSGLEQDRVEQPSPEATASAPLERTRDAGALSQEAACAEFDPPLRRRWSRAELDAWCATFAQLTGTQPELTTESESIITVTVTSSAWRSFRDRHQDASLPPAPERTACVRFHVLIDTPR